MNPIASKSPPVMPGIICFPWDWLFRQSARISGAPEALRQRRAERETHELTMMTDLAKALSKLTVLTVKTRKTENVRVCYLWNDRDELNTNLMTDKRQLPRPSDSHFG
jgi:hypothetical protein